MTFHVDISLFTREYFFEFHDASIFQNYEIMAQCNKSWPSIKYKELGFRAVNCRYCMNTIV